MLQGTGQLLSPGDGRVPLLGHPAGRAGAIMELQLQLCLQTWQNASRGTESSPVCPAGKPSSSAAFVHSRLLLLVRLLLPSK